jgi:hypothetical protein
VASLHSRVVKQAIRIREVAELDCAAAEFPAIENDEIISATRRWLQIAVVGLGLCPFAEGVYRGNRLRLRISEQRSASGLLEDLREELLGLSKAAPSECETTLLIHPWVLNDFTEYNEFLDACEALVAELDLVGEIQVASFHPLYQFAGTQADDIENYTNRSPFPMLHLLREDSVERAVAAVGDAEEIYLRNIRTLRALGHAGWQKLWRD